MRKILEVLYRSPLGRIMSFFARLITIFHRPFMVYGYVNPELRIFNKFTRISSSVVIINKSGLDIRDHVWVWHHSILDATEGLMIEEGCQIGAWVGIFTHSSENSIRLLGNQFIHISNMDRKGYTRGSVKIGAYTFIGAGSVVLPGVKIGKGCLIGAGTLVSKNIPDFSIAIGSPCNIVGNTVERDSKLFGKDDFLETYYESDIWENIQKKILENHDQSNILLNIVGKNEDNMDNFTIGQTAFLTKKITEENVRLFADVTGDYNPLHLDEDYASKTYFRKRIVHGMFVSSFISSVLGNQLPGAGSVYLYQDMKFVAPVYLEDEVTVRVEVIDWDSKRGRIKLSTEVFNQEKKLVVRGVAKLVLSSYL